jgi:hypothetical protein
VFEAQSNFSPTSAVARRLKAALAFLDRAFPARNNHLKKPHNRTIVDHAYLQVGNNRPY